MIDLEDCTLGYNNKILLKDISTTFEDKSLTALIGRNGSGKSTLMKTICGLNDKYQGKILIDSEDLREMSRNKLAKKLSYVNTNRPRIGNLKCRDVVALGRSPHTGWHGSLSSKDKEIIDQSLQLVGMTDFKNRDLNSLSDGECQKIMIARAIAQSTPIILLDEPTSFLDLPTRFELGKLLQNLVKEGKTIVYSTHELDIALKFSDYIALIDNNCLYKLPVEEMKNSGLLQAFYPI